MPVQLGSVAVAGGAARAAPPPLAAVTSLHSVTLGAGETRGVQLGGRALLVYVRSGVLKMADSGPRAMRALPGELVLADGDETFGYANGSRAEELAVLEVALAGEAERPRVMQRYYSDDEKAAKLCPIGTQAGGTGSLPLGRDVVVSLARLGRWETVLRDLAPARLAWVIVLSGKATVNNEAVSEGESARVSSSDELRIAGVSPAEVMVIEGVPRD